MKRLTSILAAVILLGAAGAALSSCKGKSGDGHDHAATQKARYHCPMHPTYVSDKQGDCPICGMRLVPIEDAIQKEPAADESTAMADRAPIALSAERQQLIGVRTAIVTKRKLVNLVRASGRVAYDPDLYNAIVEHRQALEARQKVKDSPWPDVKERADALIHSSSLRLRQMGLSQAQIQDIAASGKDPTNLLLADSEGSVWVYAQIYEFESGQIKPGQTMEVTSAAQPGRAFRGKVVAIDSILNPETRTLRVRGEVPNPGGLLKSEMYVDVALHVDLGEKVALPGEAVLKTGTRQIVFVETGPGQFEPREVTLGRKAEDHYEVIDGVTEGEKVVTSANFLIDSESRLKAALSNGGAAGGHQH